MAETADLGRLTTSTRRSFIRGIAAAGASTMAATLLDRSELVELFASQASAARRSSPFTEFRALGPSSEDAFEVPEGFRPDVLISAGDRFKDARGRTLRYGTTTTSSPTSRSRAATRA